MVIALPPDYLERVYAGVLGKLVGVYLGRPFEGWTHQRIMEELGHIKYYVHERMGMPLVVTDDDVSGTFAFVRALEDARTGDITSREIGDLWLNQVVEHQSVFWWGGRGVSTEHTAYLNLKNGIPAPRSGSIEMNGKTVAEQIGAQIFIDGWAMACPGQPEKAARLAKAAGEVSHDGESVFAAMLWAALEAEAFVSSDVDHLIDTGLRFIPNGSLIAKIVADVRHWVKTDDGDWLKTRQRIEESYGYDKFPGVCHVIPNHCLMIMALLCGGHDFSLAMEIINTCGWDTDCNAGNVGCLVALMRGMDAFDDPQRDWLGPLADRALISSADNGYAINNAARIAIDICNSGRRLAGKAPLVSPKDGAQFHFTLPGSVQGFQPSTSNKDVKVYQDRNAAGVPGLAVQYGDQAITVVTPTSAPKNALHMPKPYDLTASPLLYTGQRIECAVAIDRESRNPVTVHLCLSYFDSSNKLVYVDSEDHESLEPQSDATHTLRWILPAIPKSYPIAEIGIKVIPTAIADHGHGHGGKLWLDYLRWDGAPNLVLEKPRTKPHPFWDLAWVRDVDKWLKIGRKCVHLVKNSGRGLASFGTRQWKDYRLVVHELTPTFGAEAGVAIRVQGLRRYYALVLSRPGKMSLVKMYDQTQVILADTELDWEADKGYEVILQVSGRDIRGEIGASIIHATDDQIADGAMGIVVSDGAVSTGPIEITPIS